MIDARVARLPKERHVIDQAKIEGKAFEIALVGCELPDEWTSNDDVKFSWGVGPAGDLMIFRSKYHAAFSARLETDVRWFVYAPGTWLTVTVLDDEEVGTGSFTEDELEEADSAPVIVTE